MPIKLVPGRLVGGTASSFLIAVNDVWGRMYYLPTGELSALMPLETATKQHPSLNEPFDGDEEQAAAILEAARKPDYVFPEIDGYDLPDVDIIDR